MADYSRDVRKELRDNGCEFVRQGKGDHEIWYSPHTGLKITVDNKIKSRHTANGVLQRAGLPKKY